MRARVLCAARELGYRIDFASRSMVRRRTSTFGIYIPPMPWAGLGYSYEDAILRGVERACHAHGYDVLLINMNGGIAPQACRDKFDERRIDGLILIHLGADETWVRELVAAGHQVIAVDYSNPRPKFDAVTFDNAAASRIAVEHLAALGHRRIGFVGSGLAPQNVDATLRQAGFLDALTASGLLACPEWIFDNRLLTHPIKPQESVCELEGRAAVRHLRALGDSGPTAWVAYCDLVATFMLRLLPDAGVRVPDDVSVMGIDDSGFCGMAQPSLTSIRHPLEEMGQRAVELLVERVAAAQDQPSAPRESGRRIVFPPTLVVRDSTAAPSPGAAAHRWYTKRTGNTRRNKP